MRLAVYFHDVVYDAKAKAPENETRSADTFREFAAGVAGLSVDDIETVAQWIVRTARHLDGLASGDLAHFLDADLAIFGAPPAAYAAYAREVRMEYAHVKWADFVSGRAKVLRYYAHAETLYFTGEAASQLLGPAKLNLEAEITRLGRHSPA